MSLTQLLNMPRMREIGDAASEIMEQCNELQDLLAQYEATYDLPKQEQAEERDSVREAVKMAMAEIVSDMRVFAALHEKFDADGGGNPDNTGDGLPKSEMPLEQSVPPQPKD